MGVTKHLISPGDGKTFPERGDEIKMEYTGYLYDDKAADQRGTQFDTSIGRGDFTVRIGIGQVIQGWDEGVLRAGGGMSLGEKATLICTSDFAYGRGGFPGLIPPNSTLIFDVRLKAINNRRASYS